MARPLFQLDAVTVSGRTSPRLDTSLAIGTGVTAVIGPSGAGKTTLLDVLVGFLPPDSGKVAFQPPADGPDVPLFWSPASGGLWPHLSTREHLTAVAPSITGGAQPGGVDRWLAAFDLEAVAAVRPGHLSLGQRSRLGVARALASGASVLVLDEPFAHVDLGRATSFWDAMIDAVRQNDTTLVFATHEPSRVLAYADSVVCIDAGRVVHQGEVDELYQNPPSRELAAFLGPANWFEADETRVWTMAEAPRCLRPEQLAIEVVEESPIVVVSSRDHGLSAATILRHEGTRGDGTRDEGAGLEREFHHASRATTLEAGARVIVRICLLLLLALVVPGCSDGPAVMDIEAVRHMHLPALGVRLPAPRGLAALEDGRTIVLDNAGRVLVLRADLTTERQWRMPEYDVGRPEGVCQLRDGRVVVADTHYSRLVFFDGKGTVLATTGSHGTGPGQFIFPIKVIQDPAGFLYVAEYGGHNDRVQKFTEQGEPITSFGSFGHGRGQFQRPSGLVWQDGKIYVADAVNRRVLVFTDEGEFLVQLGGPAETSTPTQTEDDAVSKEGLPPVGEHNDTLKLEMPYDLCSGPSGDLFACEYGAGRVTRFTTEGRVVGRFGSNGRGKGQMRTPWGVAVRTDGSVLVADTGNRRLVHWK